MAKELNYGDRVAVYTGEGRWIGTVTHNPTSNPLNDGYVWVSFDKERKYGQANSAMGSITTGISIHRSKVRKLKKGVTYRDGFAEGVKWMRFQMVLEMNRLVESKERK